MDSLLRCFMYFAPKAPAPTVVVTEKDGAIVPTRFLSLGDLKAHGRLPRYGGDKDFKHPVTGQPNANLCRPHESLDALKTIFIFVSHR